MQNKIAIKGFFNKDYVDQASYDNLRKISSCVDGLKNSNRKVIWTVLEKNIYSLIKVQQLSSKTAEFTDYLHGSLDSVVSNLGQDFLGSNQLPLLKKKGNFGTRNIPTPSAPRYIFARGSDLLPHIFNHLDKYVLQHQEFEGSKIEPRFLLPTIPLLLVNGNKGVSSGFAQNIGQRNLEDILDSLSNRLKGRTKDFESFNLIPMHFNGFRGSVSRDLSTDSFKWIVEGTYEITDEGDILITELPPDTKLFGYIQYLDSLVDDKKIKSYLDECDGDDWQFRIKLTSDYQLDKEQIIKLFKLRTSVTENFTCLGVDNKILELKKPSEILDYYYSIKSEYLGKRKQYQLNEIKNLISKKEQQFRFIKAVVNRKVDIQKMFAADLYLYLKFEGYLKFDDSYKYLTSMPISSMQLDTMNRLESDIGILKSRYSDLNDKPVEQLWLYDLNELIDALSKQTKRVKK